MLEELRKLEAAATPGPWQRDGNAYSHGIRGRAPEGDIIASWDNRRSDRDAPNIILICAMRNALPALLDVAEAAHRHFNEGASPRPAREALARLQVQLPPAQGAEQRPETGAGA